MTKLELLAYDVLMSIDHLEEDEWTIAAKAVHDTLKLLHKHEYTTENVSELLTEEYARWNEKDCQEFLR